MLDIAYPKRLRDALVEEGHTGVHHLLSKSGWTTYHIEFAADFEHARWLLRLSYLSHVSVLKKRPTGSEELADVKVDSEIEAMNPSENVLVAFDRRSTA